MRRSVQKSACTAVRARRNAGAATRGQRQRSRRHSPRNNISQSGTVQTAVAMRMARE